jgi:hypothetical protein
LRHLRIERHNSDGFVNVSLSSLPGGRTGYSALPSDAPQKGAAVIGPEFGLAVACCRWRPDDGDPAELDEISRVVVWPKFLHLVRRHRVEGLAAGALKHAGVALPAPIAESIEADARSVVARNLRQAAESVRLLGAFTNASLPILFVKGLTLSALAYGDPFVKMSSDIDILVEEEKLEAAARVLSESGYVAIIPAVESSSPDLSRWHRRAKESVWRSGESDIVVELHTRLVDNRRFIPPIGLDSPLQAVSIGPAGSLPTLNTDDLFAYLSVHGATSLWFRLKWIADVAALLRACGGPTHAMDLYRGARARGAGRAPGQALLLADYLSLTRLPKDLRTELEADRVTRLLARIALREVLQTDAPMQRHLGTVFTHLTQPLLMHGLRFKFGEVSRQVNDVFQRRLGNA